MRHMKFFLAILIFLFAFSILQQTAEAHTSFSVGFSSFYGYPRYYYPFGYSSPFWYGYPYSYGFYRPFYGYGYGGGYGYGYPYSSYGRPYGYRGYDYGEIRLEVKPKTARVYVDGDYVGVVDDFDGWWQHMNVPLGRHRIVIREPGYAPYVETMRILPDRNYHIKFHMRPGQDSIADRDMRLDDRDRDRGYRDRRYDSNKDQRYQYKDRDRDRDRDYGDDDDRDYDSDHDRSDGDYDSDHRYGSTGGTGTDHRSYSEKSTRFNTGGKQTLTLAVEPRDATVYVDGNYYGTADVNDSGEVNVLLSAGTHRVEVVRSGYLTFSKEIKISRENNRLAINLRKK